MRELLAQLEQQIQERGISEEQIAGILQANRDIVNRRIIGGYASVAITDREGQRIPIAALKHAVEEFMRNIYYRPANVFHSDITVGRVLPCWTNPETGEVHRTEVDNVGWRVVIEVRDDIDIANKVWQEVLKGNIRSFSIAGSSKDKLQKQEHGISYEQINDLEVYEVTLCELPVNQEAKFSLWWNPDEVRI